jgi:NPCBM/NEW2 domain
VLTTGDRIAVSSPRIADETFQGAWQRAPLRPEIKIPLEFVAGVLREVPPARSRLNDQLAQLSRAETGHDTLVFLTGDDLQGQLSGLDGGLVDFEAAIGRSRLDLRRLRTIALDPSLAAVPEKPAQYWIVQLTDGSRVTATDVVPRDDGTVRVQPVSGDPFFAVFHELTRLTRFSDQLVPLSSRTPTAVDYQPFFAGTAAPQTDRSLRRTPLMMRQCEFPTGIGMTSRMSVTYPVLPGDQSFRASVGIDDSAREQGSVRFELLLDDVAVWSSKEVDGHAEPLPTPLIELAGHQSLTLRVDFGRNGDIGDIANWCDAVVLRNPE